MKKAIIPCGISLIFLLSFMLGCVPSPTPSPEETARQFMVDQSEGLSENQTAGKNDSSMVAGQLPVRYQKPGYMLKRSSASRDEGKMGELALPVGADISTPSGPKPLGTILGQIVALKNMSISYATDVDQNAAVTVNVRADQDFFKAVDNILRPLDYFYELDANTIIIKHKETRKYHIAMPFLNSTYTTGVGGNVLGSAENNQMNGTLSIDSTGNTFDIWTNIAGNLDKILEIWTGDESSVGGTAAANSGTGSEGTSEPNDAGTDQGVSVSSGAVLTQKAPGKGYYTIDRPIGLINVTAPRSLLVKIEDYLSNLKSELYKQISIEAKIVEVTLTEDNTTGVDWSDLFGSTFNWDVSLGPIDQLDVINLSNITNNDTTGAAASVSFATVLDLMQDQGSVEVLSNPKISVMNGQPAMISVGENVTYIDAIESTQEDGVISYSVTTSSVMSGLGMGVIATIMENDNIIISLTPVTTSLARPIEYETFGANNKVGLPEVKLREMQTLVRVKDGEMLVVGGLIDESSTYTNEKVAGLGDVPFIGKGFRTDGTDSIKKELVILMRPKIISY